MTNSTCGCMEKLLNGRPNFSELAMRARGITVFQKIQLAGQKYQDKTTLLAKCDSAVTVLVFKASALRY